MRLPEDIPALIAETERIRALAEALKDQTTARFPLWDSENDARLTSFNKLTNVIAATLLGFVFINESLLYMDWWDDHFHPMEELDKLSAASDFQALVKGAFIQSVFSATESSFRLFVRAIDPGACGGGTDDFKNVYDYLLRRVSGATDDSSALLDLFREVRNCVHNNGVYFHRSGEDRTVQYRGIQYVFRQGQPVDFLQWPFLLGLAEDVAHLLNDIVNDPLLSTIPGHIADPFS